MSLLKQLFMLRNYFLLFVFLLTSFFLFSQKPCSDDFYNKEYTKKELLDDINFIKEKIINAHINPYTEITQKQFNKQINDIKKSLEDRMTQRDFYFKAKPIFVTLNDEHSGLNDYCLPKKELEKFKTLPLRFEYLNKKVILTEDYSSKKLTIGDELLTINNIPIATIINECSKQVFGTAENRKMLAVEKLWLYLNKFCYHIIDNFNLEFASGKKVQIKGLTKSDFIKNYNLKNQKTGKRQLVSYKNIDGAGYLEVNSFRVNKKYPITFWKQSFDSIFSKIKKKNISTLFIDVSKNGGGNSKVGRVLTSYFSKKSYKGYSGKWKKSQEYSDLLHKFGINRPTYEKVTNGNIIDLPSRTITPKNNPYRFNGKTYLVVGKKTFSSAIMFAAEVLDNKLATVIGETPSKAHPNHFGELIMFKTPNTKLNFRFGVKHWIRPSGKLENNKLIPDLQIKITNRTKQEIVNSVN